MMTWGYQTSQKWEKNKQRKWDAEYKKYKDFQEYLESFVNKPAVAGKVDDPRHILIPKPIANPEVYESATGVNDAGINNVDIDREMADLAENHLFFNAGQRLIRGQFDGLRKAITGRSR